MVSVTHSLKSNLFIFCQFSSSSSFFFYCYLLGSEFLMVIALLFGERHTHNNNSTSTERAFFLYKLWADLWSRAMEGLPPGYRPNVGVCLINSDDQVPIFSCPLNFKKKKKNLFFNCFFQELVCGFGLWVIVWLLLFLDQWLVCMLLYVFGGSGNLWSQFFLCCCLSDIYVFGPCLWSLLITS